MPQIRQTSIQTVLDALTETRFGLLGFNVSFPETEALVKIKFAGDQASFFYISTARNFNLLMQKTLTSEKPDDILEIYMSPGEYKTDDTFTRRTFDECVQLIQPWAKRIYDDLRAQGKDLTDHDVFRETLNSFINNEIKDEKSRFTTEEVQDFYAKLDELTSRLQEMEKNQEITKQELAKLEQALMNAKDDLPVMTKAMWYRTAASKVWDVMQKVTSTPEGRQIMAEGAKKLLGLPE